MLSNPSLAARWEILKNLPSGTNQLFDLYGGFSEVDF